MNLKDILKVTVTNDLQTDTIQGKTTHEIELDVQFKDGSSEKVGASIYDHNLTQLHGISEPSLTGKAKELAEIEEFNQYLCKIGSTLLKAKHSEEDWYRFFEFDLYQKDFEEQADVSKRIRESMLNIRKANYLVSFKAISPISHDVKTVDYLISSNFALNVEIPRFHPLLAIFKKLNPQLDLMCEHIRNTFFGQNVIDDEVVLLNRALGFVVKISNVTKNHEHNGTEENFIRASYFYDRFNPTISQSTTVAAEKCRI